MKIPAAFALLFLTLVSAAPLPLTAQTPSAAAAEAGAQVAVSSPVKFSGARFGGDNWLEAEVEVEARPGGRAASGQFVDKVRVTLSLGMEAADDKGAKRLVFHRSSAEAITLEGGTKAFFRFYIPPEIVRRDKLRPDVKFYVVEIEAGGQPQPPAKASASNDFTSMESIRNFLAKVSAEAGQNEGVMIPQYLSPFALDSQRRAPSFVRREALR
jgi:hypothetical protein